MIAHMSCYSFPKSLSFIRGWVVMWTYIFGKVAMIDHISYTMLEFSQVTLIYTCVNILGMVCT